MPISVVEPESQGAGVVMKFRLRLLALAGSGSDYWSWEYYMNKIINFWVNKLTKMYMISQYKKTVSITVTSCCLELELKGIENRSGNVMKTGAEAEANSFGSTKLCRCSFIFAANRCKMVAKKSYIIYCWSSAIRLWVQNLQPKQWTFWPYQQGVCEFGSGLISIFGVGLSLWVNLKLFFIRIPPVGNLNVIIVNNRTTVPIIHMIINDLPWPSN